MLCNPRGHFRGSGSGRNEVVSLWPNSEHGAGGFTDDLFGRAAEQDVRQSLAASSRAYVVENGRVAAEGAADGLMHDPRIRKAYLGL